VLERVLPRTGVVLEIASGTGQHVAHFAKALPEVVWQPSDADSAFRASIVSWIGSENLGNVRPPLDLDVRGLPWPVTRADAVLCINMIHVAPWAATQALLTGAKEILVERGVLVLYGPYRRFGRHTAASNEAFDRQLRATDAEWGLRDMEAVVALADTVGFELTETIEMPANNVMIIFRSCPVSLNPRTERMAKSFKEYEHEGWNQKASQYERFTLPLTSQGFKPILASFGDLAGKRLLDVCTGPGHLAAEAAARGALVHGVDFSEAMIGEANARFSSVDFREGDAEALPYEDAIFDAVACCFGLLHLPDPAQGVREAYRTLRPGGRYSVTLWNGPERGGDLFKVILKTITAFADMNVDLPTAPPMFELSEPGRIESLMNDAGFIDIKRIPIASAWRTRRAEDIVELLNYGTVRTSLIIQFQKLEVRERIMEELVKAFRPYERGMDLEVDCTSILATGVKPN
jgi:ubiquinone/menaquinone biosynthesis C-methylase UbiE